jgi:hypothetical protein
VVPLQDPRTTAGAPTSTREALVAVPPASIGVGGALRDVRVPVPVAERREAVTRTVGANVFTALAVAPSAERARIVAALVATSSTSSTAAVQALVRAVGTSSAVAPAEAEHAVARRGLDALRDTDGDGISDFDEREIYHTDPNDPFTAHGVLSDGERVLLGLDPRTRDLTPVPVASPQEEGTTTADLFTVGAITLATSSDPAAAGGAAGIHITGTADPFAFVTLFVYSTPVVVTVRADVTGTYDYTLDTSLADGSHELYVASVDNAGRILAKSDPVPFVKTAQAVEYTPPGGTPTRDPASAALQRTVTFALLALLLAAFAVLVGVGVRASRPGTAHEVSIGHDENTPA